MRHRRAFVDRSVVVSMLACVVFGFDEAGANVMEE